MKAPAFPNDDSFYCRFFTEVSSLKDCAGRPLHEVDFRAEDLQAAYQVCPFQDSRKGYLMNQAALEQISSEWKEVLAGVSFYASLFPESSPWENSLARSWRISLASMFAPLFLLHRKEDSYPSGSLPTSVSGVFKILLDVSTTLDLMILQGRGREKTQDLAREIQLFADHSGILLNGEYACAGSPRLLEKVLGIFFSPAVTTERSEFDSYFPNREELLHFSYLMSCQYALSQLYQFTYMQLFEKLAERNSQDAHSLTSDTRLSAYERRRRIALAVMSDADGRVSAFSELAQLIHRPSLWTLRELTPESLDDGIKSSLELLSVSDIAPKEAVGLFCEFEFETKQKISTLQQEIQRLVQCDSMFQESVIFGSSGSQPSERIRAYGSECFEGEERCDKKTP